MVSETLKNLVIWPSQPPSTAMSSSKPPSAFFSGATVVCVVIAALNPINSTLSRGALLACLGLAAVTLARRLHPRYPRAVKITVSALLGLTRLIGLLPGRPANPNTLRARYLSAPTTFEGTRYIWGGEGRFGIDCSGLPRRALRTALVREALVTANPSLLRQALSQWWFDASARALSQGYRSFTQPLPVEGTLKKLVTSTLLPGDLAITHDGIHLIVYLGEDRWIQADPSHQKVVTLNAKTDTNLWFNIGVSLHRWSLLTP